jgi:hypothetical protein
MYRSILYAVAVVPMVGCDDAAGPDGPPEILQVFARERVDVDGVIELHARLAYGDHPDIDRELDDREVGAAVARDGQRLRVVFDRLLRGNALEEVACADGSWTRVPVGTDYEDVAACAGPDLSRCEGLCLDAGGILDENGDGAFDDTRLIDGAVTLSCDGAVVPLDPERSFYQPSGTQQLSAGSVGTDSLGPAVVLVPAGGMAPRSRCNIAFSDQVVDKQDRPVGDTSAIDFAIEAFQLVASDPADGAADVALTAEGSEDAVIAIQLNAALDPETVRHAVRIDAGASPLDDVEAEVSPDDDATILVTLPGGFEAATTYVVTVAGDVEDVHGDRLDAETTITWITRAP